MGLGSFGRMTQCLREQHADVHLGGQANGLSKPLDNAIRSLDKGNVAAACNQLNDFIAEVNTKTPSPLDAATAADLIADAQAIQTAIGCP